MAKRTLWKIFVIIEISIILYLITETFAKKEVSQDYLLYMDEDLPNSAPFFKISEDPILSHELISSHYQIFEGFQTKLNKTIIQINSDGLRDDEYNATQSNNTIKIIALGDSFTFGLGVNNSDTWPKTLERELNKLDDSTHYEVLNFGVPGYNTLEEIRLFKLKGLKYRPDIVIVGYLPNDAMNNTKIKTGELDDEINKLLIPYGNLSQDRRSVLSASLSSQLLEEDLSQNFDIYIAQHVQKPLEELGNISEKENMKIIIVFLYKISDIEDAIIKDISKNYNFCVIDAHEYLEKFSFKIRTLSQIDTHPNEFGHKLIADYIFIKLINECGL